MRSFAGDTSRGRRTDVSMGCTPPPKKTEIETKTGKETEGETDAVKEVNSDITWSFYLNDLSFGAALFFGWSVCFLLTIKFESVVACNR